MSETSKYIEAVGRRKTASARVRLTEASKQSVIVNDKELADYFPLINLQRTALASLTHAAMPHKFKITVKVAGGGISSQAEAIRLGISRAIIDIDGQLRTKLKTEGFLKRDPRAKERRKFGLKKARKAPQWSKR